MKLIDPQILMAPSLLPNGFLVRLKNKGLRLFGVDVFEVKDTGHSLPATSPDFKDLDFDDILFVYHEMEADEDSEPVIALIKLDVISVRHGPDRGATVDDLIRSEGFNGLQNLVNMYIRDKFPEMLRPAAG